MDCEEPGFGQALDHPPRLASLDLSGLMSVRSDDVLDRMVKVAARVIDAPVVLVSLVDTARQHFPSQVGLPEPWASAAETPLSYSLCQHVVRSGAPLVITDARRSEIAAGSGAVSVLGVEAYAGFPLLDATGNVLGSFCAIDTKPRAWTSQELATVADFGALVQSEVRSRIALHRYARRLALLGEVTAALHTELDLESAVRAMCDRLVPAFTDTCLVDLIEVEGGFRLAALASHDPVFVDELEAIEAEQSRLDNPGSVVRRVIETGTSELLPVVDAAVLRDAVPDAAQRERYRRLGVSSAVVTPIRTRNRVAGALTMHRLGPTIPFDAADMRLAEELGDRLGVALENAQAFEREHQTALALQEHLLTPPPPIPDLDVAVRYRPSNRSAQVGGDWYDVLALSSGQVGLAVGDVAGHDIRAAATMGQIRAVLRSYAWEDATPGSVLDRVCRLVRIVDDSQLATAFYGVLGPRCEDGGRHLRYASAGHPPPVLMGNDGSARLVEGVRSPMIGIETAPRPEGETSIDFGGALVLFTDGVIEHRRRPLSDGLDALVDALRDYPIRSADGIADHVLAAVRPPQGWEDDVALLVVRPL